jgi:hypothetical protein
VGSASTSIRVFGRHLSQTQPNLPGTAANAIAIFPSSPIENPSQSSEAASNNCRISGGGITFVQCIFPSSMASVLDEKGFQSFYQGEISCFEIA